MSKKTPTIIMYHKRLYLNERGEEVARGILEYGDQYQLVNSFSGDSFLGAAAPLRKFIEDNFNIKIREEEKEIGLYSKSKYVRLDIRDKLHPAGDDINLPINLTDYFRETPTISWEELDEKEQEEITQFAYNTSLLEFEYPPSMVLRRSTDACTDRLALIVTRADNICLPVIFNAEITHNCDIECFRLASIPSQLAHRANNVVILNDGTELNGNEEITDYVGKIIKTYQKIAGDLYIRRQSLQNEPAEPLTWEGLKAAAELLSEFRK